RRAARVLAAPLRALARAVHDRRGKRALWPRRRAEPARSRAPRRAGPRRVAPRWDRARVVRSRGAAPAAARVAGRAPPRSRAGRAGRVRPLRPVLVRPARRHRPRGGGGPARAVGPRLGGRGHERRVGAASRGTPLPDPVAARPRAAFLATPLERVDRDAGALVTRRTPVRR